MRSVKSKQADFCVAHANAANDLLISLLLAQISFLVSLDS